MKTGRMCAKCGKPHKGHPRGPDGCFVHDNPVAPVDKFVVAREYVTALKELLSKMELVDARELARPLTDLLGSVSTDDLLKKTFVVKKPLAVLGFDVHGNGDYTETMSTLTMTAMEKKIFEKCKETKGAFHELECCIYVACITFRDINYVYVGKTKHNVMSRWINPSSIAHEKNSGHGKTKHTHLQGVADLLKTRVRKFGFDSVLARIIECGVGDARLVLFVADRVTPSDKGKLAEKEKEWIGAFSEWAVAKNEFLLCNIVHNPNLKKQKLAFKNYEIPK